MRITALIIICCLFSSLAGAQSNLTISGKLLDKETETPLVFASIGVKGKSESTVSNSDGEFDFHIPASYRNEKMVVSMLGYLNYEQDISSLLSQDSIVIRMNKAVQVLDEVIIKDSLMGGDIARIAISRIEQNYPAEPFILDGFYRDLKKLGGTYFSLLEAAVKIYDEDYREPKNKFRLRERVALIEVRKSLRYADKFTHYFDESNLLEDLLLHNHVRYRQFPDDELFFDSFKRTNTSFYNGHRVFVIEQNRDYKLKMYIDTENYAIIRMEVIRFYDNEIIKKKNNIVSRYISDKKTIDFKKYQGKMYLNYMNVTSKINWYDAESDTLRFETELHRELMINKVFPKAEQRIASTQKMRRYGLQYQDEPYNKTFWENYNVIKETPLDKRIVADLEKMGELDEQFENN